MGFISNLPRLPPRGSDRMANPYHAVRDLTWMQQALFWCGWLAWVSDAYDFFCVPLTLIRLEAQFGRSTHAVTTALTLTLLLRSVGAVFFGLLADRFGRRWPLIIDLLIIAILQIGTGFVRTFSEFLAVRSLFGIAMGGVWGLASAGSMESMPVGSRGVYSGFMQIGYTAGFLISSLVNLFLVPETPETWRTIYWVGAGISTVAAVLRAMLPETAVFERSQEVARKAGMTTTKATRIFFRSLYIMFKTHWSLWVYGVILLTGMTFLAHGSQDLYTTFMQNSKGFSDSLSTEANIISQIGAVVGAAVGGFISQFLGRRLTLIVACVWCYAFIPLWILPSGWGALSAGGFFFQVGVNTAWGVIAIYLYELAPPGFRGLYPSTVYQLGNAVSSAASQIEATAGLSIRKQVRGVDQPDYGTVQVIVAAAACGLIFICAIFGPERHSVHFEDEKTVIEAGVSSDIRGSLTNTERSSRDEDKKTEETLHFEGYS